MTSALVVATFITGSCGMVCGGAVGLLALRVVSFAVHDEITFRVLNLAIAPGCGDMNE